MTLLIIITLVLLAIGGHQLLRVSELSRKIKGEPEWKVKESDNRLMGILLFSFVFVFFVLDRKSTRLNSSHIPLSRMPSSA